MTNTESAADFLASRKSWLQVMAVNRPDRRGWDIVLRLDGTYSDCPDMGIDKDGMVEHWAEYLAEVLHNEGITLTRKQVTR